MFFVKTSGCYRDEYCDKPMPDYVFTAGEQAIFNITGEKIRVMRRDNMVSKEPPGSVCFENAMQTYTVRFEDASEVSVHWSELIRID